LFMKKSCFEYEKELRATILLPQEQWHLPERQRGLSIACDLDVLINCVHVSPLLRSMLSTLWKHLVPVKHKFWPNQCASQRC
jgi:hypothetical protein